MLERMLLEEKVKINFFLVSKMLRGYLNLPIWSPHVSMPSSGWPCMVVPNFAITSMTVWKYIMKTKIQTHPFLYVRGRVSKYVTN
jgi:hypothetical protein